MFARRMIDARRFEVIEIHARSPSFINQHLMQAPRAVEELDLLSRANGKINSLIRFGRKRTHITHDHFIVPELVSHAAVEEEETTGAGEGPDAGRANTLRRD